MKNGNTKYFNLRNICRVVKKKKITHVFRYLKHFSIRGPLFRNTICYCISCDGIK